MVEEGEGVVRTTTTGTSTKPTATTAATTQIVSLPLLLLLFR
jgi:hypothetical protein